MTEIKANFTIIAPSGVIADIDVLDPSITGFQKSEVQDVKISPYFPGNPYLEPGVANHWNHACYGSMSYFVTDIYNNIEIISPIFFHDKSTTHYGGSTHWNTEFWRYRQGSPPMRVKRLTKEDIHQLDQTNWLEIRASGTDFPMYTVTLAWEK